MNRFNNKDQSGQILCAEDLDQVAGGDGRWMAYPGQICPICGKKITGMSLEAHIKGHPLSPCPVCGRLMPAGPGAKCFHCGYCREDANN